MDKDYILDYKHEALIKMAEKVKNDKRGKLKVKLKLAENVSKKQEGVLWSKLFNILDYLVKIRKCRNKIPFCGDSLLYFIFPVLM